MGNHNLSLTFLAGLGKVNGSILHLGQDDDGLIIDCGGDLGAESAFLGGRLRPRDSRGIDDRLELGFLPKVHDFYRSDAVIDTDLLKGGRRLPVSAVHVTHAHQDHASGLAAVDFDEIGVHCSLITAAILHSEWICGSGLMSETTFVYQREPHPEEVGLIRKPRKGELIAREFWIVDGPIPRSLAEMWAQTGAIGGLNRSNMVVAGMPYRSHRLDHSIWGTTGFSFETKAGLLSHLADCRLHGTDADFSRDSFREIVKLGPRFLAMEGTRLGRPNEGRQITEAECREAILELVRTAGKRLVIGSISPRHTERLSAFILAAIESGRRLLLPARTVALLETIAAADSRRDLLSLEGIGIYDPSSSNRRGWHEDIRERYENLLVHPNEVKRNPEKFITLYGFASSMDLIDLQPHGALFIWSSSAAYSDEARSRNSTLREFVRIYGMDTEGIIFGKGAVDFDPKLNPSGHLHPDDLKRLVQKIKPEILLPVHTEHAEMFREFAPKGTEVIIGSNGRTMKF